MMSVVFVHFPKYSSSALSVEYDYLRWGWVVAFVHVDSLEIELLSSLLELLLLQWVS
jgi:hypothetical protein